MTDQCKKTIYTGTWARSSQCSRKAVADGYCKQHHPDSVKARREKSAARWEEQRKQTSHYRLGEALDTIKALADREQELMVFIDSIKPQLSGLSQRDARSLIEGQVGTREPIK